MSLYYSIRKKRDSNRQSKYLSGVSQPHFQDDPIEQLPSKVLLQLDSGREDDQIVPGQMTDVHVKNSDTSPFAFKSGSALPTTIVRGSFHRRAGIREEVDGSGSFLFRKVEIKRSQGESIGFYIRQGDGWNLSDGVFVSRVNLGSVVEVNDLLHVGEEIVKVNGVDVTNLALNDVVVLMQNVQKKLVLTVKIQTSQTILHRLSAKKMASVEEDSGSGASSGMPQLTEYSAIESSLEDSRLFEPTTSEATIHSPIHSTDDLYTGCESEIPHIPLPMESSTPNKHFYSPTDSPESSPLPTPPMSPVPKLTESPPRSPQLETSISLSTPEPYVYSSNSSSQSNNCELSNSLKELFDTLPHFDEESQVMPPSSSPPPSLPPTPPLSPPPPLPAPSTSILHTPFSLTQSQSSTLTPSLSPHASFPPTTTLLTPPLKSSVLTPPPPVNFAYEPLTPDTPEHLFPPTSKPPPTDSDDGEEDLFRLQNIESHLRHWLTRYENNELDELSDL